MATHVQGQHRAAHEQLTASNKNGFLHVMNTLASNADLDYGLYKLECMCSLVLRLNGR